MSKLTQQKRETLEYYGPNDDDGKEGPLLFKIIPIRNIYHEYDIQRTIFNEWMKEQKIYEEKGELPPRAHYEKFLCTQIENYEELKEQFEPMDHTTDLASIIGELMAIRQRAANVRSRPANQEKKIP